MTIIPSTRFDGAFAYASRLHARQKRKGTKIPYVAHLLAVTAIVLEYGGGEDEAIAALLHDAVEDQGGPATRTEILGRFGKRVVAIVDGCTDTDTEPKPPWRQRKEAYVAHVGDASPSVRLVSAADKLHNARSILADYRLLGEALWESLPGRARRHAVVLPGAGRCLSGGGGEAHPPGRRSWSERWASWSGWSPGSGTRGGTRRERGDRPVVAELPQCPEIQTTHAAKFDGRRPTNVTEHCWRRPPVGH